MATGNEQNVSITASTNLSDEDIEKAVKDAQTKYDEAKNEQGKLYSRIAELENILANCSVIEEEDSDTNTVRLGSKITVEDVEMGEQETYEVVGSQEADPMNGRISEESPFGKALLGKAIGEEVVVDAPVGTLRYQIVNVEKA